MNTKSPGRQDKSPGRVKEENFNDEGFKETAHFNYPEQSFQIVDKINNDFQMPTNIFQKINSILL